MIAKLNSKKFKFIDEAGVNLAMSRVYGRAPRGERVVDSVPQNCGANITMLASLGRSDLAPLMTGISFYTSCLGVEEIREAVAEH